jgi:hypothetical protein
MTAVILYMKALQTLETPGNSLPKRQRNSPEEWKLKVV